jgi:hypothetical protein
MPRSGRTNPATRRSPNPTSDDQREMGTSQEQDRDRDEEEVDDRL